MMYPTNATLSIRPGTTPPISSFEIEIPDRLPSSTVRAEGGINISTAPIAMIGHVASTGLYPRDSMTGSINDPSMAVVAMGEPGMEENLAHQHEERNWRQREIDHRRGAVPEHLA